VSLSSTSVEFPSAGVAPAGRAHRNERKRGRLDPLDPAVDRAVLRPAKRQLAARPQVDLGAGVGEPGAEVPRLRDEAPDVLDGRVDHDLSL
jgi:hypothetical protein